MLTKPRRDAVEVPGGKSEGVQELPVTGGASADSEGQVTDRLEQPSGKGTLKSKPARAAMAVVALVVLGAGAAGVYRLAAPADTDPGAATGTESGAADERVPVVRLWAELP